MGNSKAKYAKDEAAYEYLTYGHGVFTFYTLLGLNQAVPPTPDGKIYFADLSTYVQAAVLNATGHKQFPSAITADPTLIAVDDASKEGIQIERPQNLKESSSPAPVVDEVRNASPRGVTSDSRPDLISRFESALHGNRLLPGEKDDAFDLLHEMEQSTSSTQYSTSGSQRLRVALEERGQAVILKYLKGDQVPQVEADFRLGERYFRAALDLAPDAAFDESRWLFCRGRAEIFEKQYRTAAHTLDIAISIDPERAYAYNAMGIAYLEQISTKRATFDEAQTAFRTAIRLAPYWAYPRHNLALANAEAGKFDLAIATYQQARLLAPTYSYLPYNLGLLYQQINQVQEAKKAYEDALQLARKDCSATPDAKCSAAARVLTALGVLNETEGKKRAAEEQYQRALQQDPKLLEARHDLAALWTRSNRHAVEAEKLWEENLSLDSSHLPSLVGLSELLLKRGEFTQSLPYYEQVLQIRPDYAPAILAVAKIRTATGNPQAALAILDDKGKLMHDSPQYWAARAEVHLSLNDLKAARSEYTIALEKAQTRQERTALRKEFRDRLRISH